MLAPPASPRAGTKRMLPRSPKASRIGMLWIEMTPNAALTSHCSRKAAMAQPTVILFCLGMTGNSSRYIDVTAGRIGRQRRGQEYDRARRLFGQAEAAELNVFS